MPNLERYSAAMELDTLPAAITATRTARDNAARAAQRARAIGIPTMGTELDLLAASYDRLLANLLYLEDELRRIDQDPRQGDQSATTAG